MVSMFASNVVNCGFECRSDKTNEYKIGIGCFSDKHATLRKKGKLLIGSESSDTSNDINYKNPSKHLYLVQSEHHHHFIEL